MNSEIDVKCSTDRCYHFHHVPECTWSSISSIVWRWETVTDVITSTFHHFYYIFVCRALFYTISNNFAGYSFILVIQPSNKPVDAVPHSNRCMPQQLIVKNATRQYCFVCGGRDVIAFLWKNSLQRCMKSFAIFQSFVIFMLKKNFSL